jgi:hypothetical protein
MIDDGTIKTGIHQLLLESGGFQVINQSTITAQITISQGGARTARHVTLTEIKFDAA